MGKALFNGGLLAGTAVALAATSAQAGDDLSALKAQLQSLQAQVNQLEARPAAPVLPEGTNWITFIRGGETMADWRPHERPSDVAAPDHRGFTIAITPSADMPAPVHEVTIGGFVKGDVIYDFNQDLGPDFFVPDADDAAQNAPHVRLHAWQSRFNIRSRSDTAIGQIRTLIEGDFFGSTLGVLRMRHAWGEWDMTPNLTFGVGQTSRVFLENWGIPTVDNEGPAGVIDSTRAPQVRLAYHAGPSRLTVAILDPRNRINFPGAEPDDRTSKAPDFEASWRYSAPGGHSLMVAGTLVPLFTDEDVAPGGSDRDRLGWAVMGGGNLNLADFATLSAGVIYGDGYSNLIGQPTGAFIDAGNKIRTIGVLGLFAGLSTNLSETTSANVGWGWTRLDRSDINAWAARDIGTERLSDVMTVHANLMWRPVRALQLGWEIMYGRNTYREFDGADIDKTNNDAWRAQFGAWFYF